MIISQIIRSVRRRRFKTRRKVFVTKRREPKTKIKRVLPRRRRRTRKL